MKKASLLFLTFVFGFTSIQAQDSTQTSTSWVQTGIGLSFVQNIDDATSALLGFQIQHNNHLFSFRTSITGSIIGTSYQDFGILYGQIFTPLDSRFFGSMSLGAGFSLTNQSNLCLFGCGSSSSSVKAKFTVPVQASFQYRPIKFLGLGITGIGNFSTYRSYSGLLFSIHLGRFRD
ncbi:hypothetical protein [Gracilimonas sp.]|uniref:hypothetical protein n=1 Tax=Gracilimonas sp. TaxID=1974203 RepID=UPI0032ED4AA2